MPDAPEKLPVRDDGESGDQPSPHLKEPDSVHESEEDLIAIIAAKEARKVEAFKEEEKSIWFGLGTFGMIGWSVAVPALLCVALGIWIDSRWPSSYSWTLMLLVVGVALGCANAWYWVTRERGKMT